MRKIKNYKKKHFETEMLAATIAVAKNAYKNLKDRFNQEDCYLKPYYKGLLTQIINKLDALGYNNFDEKKALSIVRVIESLGLHAIYKDESNEARPFLKLQYIGNMALYRLTTTKLEGVQEIWDIQKRFIKMWARDVDTKWKE